MTDDYSMSGGILSGSRSIVCWLAAMVVASRGHVAVTAKFLALPGCVDTQDDGRTAVMKSKNSVRLALLLASLATWLTVSPSVALAQGEPSPGNQVDGLLQDYRQVQGHFTLGLDLVSIGTVRKDKALGYPRSALAANLALGVTWRTYTVPSESEVRVVAERVAARYGADGRHLDWDEFRAEVRRELNRSWFRYFGIHTVALIVPGIEFGWTYDTAGVSGSGAAFDVGIAWGLSTILIPTPYIGVTYSF